MMVYFRKRLTPEIIGEINEMIIAAEQAKAEKAEKEADDSDDDDKNSGTMIVDATCAPSQISFPQDVSLLNKARECSEKIIDELHVKGEKSHALIARRRIRTTHPTLAAASRRQNKRARQSGSSLVISKETSQALKR